MHVQYFCRTRPEIDRRNDQHEHLRIHVMLLPPPSVTTSANWQYEASSRDIRLSSDDQVQPVLAS